LENGSPTAHYTLVHTDEGAGGAGTWMWFRRHYQVLTCSENHL